MKYFVSAFCLVALWVASPLFSQIDARTATVPPPKTSFMAVRPLANVKFDPSHFNMKQQQLREHHLKIPIGQLPLGRRPMALARPGTGSEIVDLRKVVRPIEAMPIEILLNHELTDAETHDDTSTVSEPSVAVRDKEILLTGNWFAAFSKDGGMTFSYRNPETSFPDIPGRLFCCDQVALYDKRHDVMFWFLQYGKDGTGNTVRLSVAAGEDIPNERWRYYDFTPQDVGNWTNEWFDFPDVVAGNKFLYVTSNVFSITNDFRRAVVLRLPLEKLLAYDGFSYRYFDQTDVGSLRPAAGASNPMYIGAHLNLGTIRVFSWLEDLGNPIFNDLEVTPWSNAPAVAPGPDGKDWLGFSDGRITAAWQSGKTLGFGWTAPQDNNLKFPHVRIAIIDVDSKKVIAEPHIWNDNYAFAYPSIAPNTAGEVGISVSYGGNALFPSHAIGVMRAPGNWTLMSTANGENGPDQNRWGDYLSLRAHGSNPSAWVATGYYLKGGSDRKDVKVLCMEFRAGAPVPPGKVAAQPDIKETELEAIRKELRQIRELLKEATQKK